MPFLEGQGRQSLLSKNTAYKRFPYKFGIRACSMDVSKPPPQFPGNLGILAPGINHQHRAFRRQQFGDHRAYTLARPRRCEGQEVDRAVIAQQPPGVWVATDQQTVRN